MRGLRGGGQTSYHIQQAKDGCACTAWLVCADAVRAMGTCHIAHGSAAQAPKDGAWCAPGPLVKRAAGGGDGVQHVRLVGLGHAQQLLARAGVDHRHLRGECGRGGWGRRSSARRNMGAVSLQGAPHKTRVWAWGQLSLSSAWAGSLCQASPLQPPPLRWLNPPTVLPEAASRHRPLMRSCEWSGWQVGRARRVVVGACASECHC